jgi:hypothetical protein
MPSITLLLELVQQVLLPPLDPLLDEASSNSVETILYLILLPILTGSGALINPEILINPETTIIVND